LYSLSPIARWEQDRGPDRPGDQSTADDVFYFTPTSPGYVHDPGGGAGQMLSFIKIQSRPKDAVFAGVLAVISGGTLFSGDATSGGVIAEKHRARPMNEPGV